MENKGLEDHAKVKTTDQSCLNLQLSHKSNFLPIFAIFGIQAYL